MTTMTWIDVMGLPLQTVEATILSDRIYVDEDTLGTMESSVLDAQITGPENSAAFAKAIRNTARDAETGLFDVTDYFGIDELNPIESYVVA